MTTANNLQSASPIELLSAVVAQGTSLEHALQMLLATHRASAHPAQQAYVRVAQKHLGDDTGLKIEDNAPVCLANAQGAWVQCWAWVPANLVSDLDPLVALVSALQSPFEQVVVEIESQDVHGLFTPSELELNPEVRDAVQVGQPLPQTWALRGLNDREERFELSVRQLQRLSCDKDTAGFSTGEDANNPISLSFLV